MASTPTSPHQAELGRYFDRYGLFESPNGLSGIVRYKGMAAVAAVLDAMQAAGKFYKQEARVTVPLPTVPDVTGATILNLGDFGNPTNLTNLRAAILAAANRTVVIRVPNVNAGSTTSNGVVNFSSNGAGNQCRVIVVGEGLGSIWNLGHASAFFNCMGSVVQFWNLRILLSTALGGVVFGRDSGLTGVNHSGIYNCQIDGSPTNAPLVMYGSELFTMRDSMIQRNNAGVLAAFDSGALAAFGGSGAGTNNTSSGIKVDSCIFFSDIAGAEPLMQIGGTTTDMEISNCWFNPSGGGAHGAYSRVVSINAYPLEPSRQAIPRRILFRSNLVESPFMVGVTDADGQFKEIWVKCEDARVRKGEFDFTDLGRELWRTRLD